MADLIVALATIEQRPIWEILNDLSAPSGDVFRLKIAGSVTSQGSFPLDEAIKLFQGGRQLLWSSAFGLLRPESLHPHRKIKQVEDFLKTCRLGQTERGSFVATIFAPVPPEIQPALANLDAGQFQLEQPFARQVTTRVMSSLGLVASAIQTGRPEQLLDAIPRGVSANLCDALVMMKPPGDESRLDVDVTWSRNRSAPAGRSAPVCLFPAGSIHGDRGSRQTALQKVNCKNRAIQREDPQREKGPATAPSRRRRLDGHGHRRQRHPSTRESGSRFG